MLYIYNQIANICEKAILKTYNLTLQLCFIVIFTLETFVLIHFHSIITSLPLNCAFVIFVLLLFLIRFFVCYFGTESWKSHLALKSCKICNLRAYTSARTLCQPRYVVMATTLDQHLCIREAQGPAAFYSTALCLRVQRAMLHM